MTKKQPIAIPFHHRLQYGFGDIVRTWLMPDSWCGVLENLSKEKKIHLLVCCHNGNAIQFFKYTPYIIPHWIIWKGHSPPYQQIARRIPAKLMTQEERASICKKYRYKTTDIHLSPAENEIFHQITAEPYVVVHPFAGGKNRMPIDPKHYRILIDMLIEQTGQKVVVIGGSFQRHKRFKTIPGRDINEEFDYERPGLTNLVNKTTLRLPTKLVIASRCFFGNWSAFLCAAWERKIPAIVFFGEQGKNIPNNKNFKRRWHNKCFAIKANSAPPKKIFANAVEQYIENIN